MKKVLKNSDQLIRDIHTDNTYLLNQANLETWAKTTCTVFQGTLTFTGTSFLVNPYLFYNRNEMNKMDALITIPIILRIVTIQTNNNNRLYG